MRRFGFWLGAVVLACGAITGLFELVSWARGAHATSSLGSIWFQIHANSLVGFQALIEQRISPMVWPPIQALLTWPAWLVLGVPGLALILLCWPRKAPRSPEDPA
jgi:hypothetical protein